MQQFKRVPLERRTSSSWSLDLNSDHNHQPRRQFGSERLTCGHPAGTTRMRRAAVPDRHGHSAVTRAAREGPAATMVLEAWLVEAHTRHVLPWGDQGIKILSVI